jgi:threonine/homoserine/homoserine lactone efflux protein
MSLGDAVGELLALAVAVAIFPIPIVTVVLLLGSTRGRANGAAFLAGWVAGVAGAGTVLLLLADGLHASEDGQPAEWVPWLKLGLGVLLGALAVKQWLGRPRGGEQVETPAWMQAVEGFSPPKAAGTGIALSALNPKNIVLIAAAASAIAETGISAEEQALALAVFVVVASVG